MRGRETCPVKRAADSDVFRNYLSVSLMYFFPAQQVATLSRRHASQISWRLSLKGQRRTFPSVTTGRRAPFCIMHDWSRHDGWLQNTSWRCFLSTIIAYGSQTYMMYVAITYEYTSVLPWRRLWRTCRRLGIREKGSCLKFALKQ